jgi:hypothetical protein
MASPSATSLRTNGRMNDNSTSVIFEMSRLEGG